jgi:very-short-patch-repair endonuclease
MPAGSADHVDASGRIVPGSESRSYDALLRKKIEDLRSRLLNLTLSNKLLSFAHSDRSRGFVRVVDELPDVLFKKLSDGQMSFIPLPPLEAELPDEQTDEFRRAVDAARLSDDVYRIDLAALEEEGETDDAGEHAEAIERALKDRVRHALSLPPRQTEENMSLAEHARLHRISPSFDLPGADTDPTDNRWQDRHIQLLLLPETAERKLSGLADLATEYLQETGINTLFAAFGFLHWYEDANSDRPRYAPLLLLPLSIQRRLEGHEYVYAIAGNGDEPQINLALREKLKADFGLALPDLAEDEAPETYMARVAQAFEREKRWKVRRWVTVGIFPFARMALYHDLDPARWPAGRGPLAHEVISDMLIGRESGASDEESEIDDAVLAQKLPLLITDADSSQAAAIIDAMERPTLVVKGPPGTGKSQTITNLIAAAMHRGERVLFVAEKLAALNVVHSRLKDAGLDSFCLELHSEKARKTDVLKSLKERLELKNDYAPSDLDAKLTELEALRDELNRYARLLNSALGVSGLSVHDVLWAAQRAQGNAGRLPEKLRGLSVKNATSLTEDSIERAKGLLAAVEKAYGAMTRNGVGWTTHNWRGVGKMTLTPFDVEDIGDSLLAWQSALKGIATANAALNAALGWAPRPSLASVDLVARSAALAAPGERNLRLSLLAALHDDVVRRDVGDFLAAIEEHSLLHAKLTTELDGSIDLLPEVLTEIGAKAANLQCGAMTPKALTHAIADLETRLEELKSVVGAAEDLAASLGHADPLRMHELKLLVVAATVVAEIPREVLATRQKSLLDEGVRPLLERGRDEVAKLKKAEADLSKLFHLERDATAETLEATASILRNAGRFAVFSRSYRQSKRFYKDFAKGARIRDLSLMAAELDDVATYRRGRAKLESDEQLKAVCGMRFAGLNTDFGVLLRAIAFIEKVRTQFAGAAPLTQCLRAALVEGDMAVIDGIRAEAAKPSLAVMVRLVEGEGAGSRRLLCEATLDLEKRIGELAILRAEIVGAGLQDKNVTLSDVPRIAAEIVRLGELMTAIGGNTAVRCLLGKDFLSERTDVSGIADSIAYVEQLIAGELPEGLRILLLTENVTRQAAVLKLHASALKAAADEAEQARGTLGTAAAINWHRFFNGLDVAKIPVPELLARIDACNEDRTGLAEWSALLDAIETGRKHSLGLVLDAFLEEHWPLVGLFDAYELIVYRSMAREAYQLEGGVLARHSGLGHEALRSRFRELDREILLLCRAKLAADLQRRPIPYGIGKGPRGTWTERALVDNEIEKVRRHIPLRDLMKRAGAAVQAMKPCFMMSPLSIAQYIPPGTIEFDLLIIDEASQMKPEEAIGAFVRSKRVVVVGDPQQLPPTSFFERNLQIPTDEEDEPEEKIANESILDMALACFRPARTLRWHYRSKHGSLIAFSNRHFYGDQLIVFPTPNHLHPDFGVHYRHVDGVYEASTNPIEAKAVCEAAIDFMRRHPERSLGVVALNQPQRELIREEMERLIAGDDRAAAYIERWADTLEPFIIKNLENIQGDERDTIYLSTIFGPDRNGSVMQRFGPVNSVNGHRRLNVLFSRAKLQTVVFSSMTADQIRAEPSSSRGVHALKGYLSFAATGTLDGGEIGGREPDSDFEIWVAEQIRATGCQAIAQVGVAGYFIDIGVKHPAYPHGFLLGVECDGAMYHSGKAARDRDRLRQEVLEKLGWELHRIWSTDWFRNPVTEVDKLRQRIAAAVRKKAATLETNSVDGAMSTAGS